MASSIYNLQSVLAVTPALIDSLGYEKLVFRGSDGTTLPYRRLIANPDRPGRFFLMIFFHRAGSVGEDNFLQMRIPSQPFASCVKEHRLKTVLLFPQCRAEHKWVDVP